MSTSTKALSLVLGALVMLSLFSLVATVHAASSAYVTETVGSLQESVISIFTTNMAPAVGQSFTLYGSLQNGVSGAPLAGQPVNLTIIYPSGQIAYMPTTTDANGAYTLTLSESAQGTYIYRIHFWGNAGYSASQAMVTITVGNPIPTTLSLNITDKNPAVNQPFTISGYLTDINGTPLSGRQLSVDAELGREAAVSGGAPVTNSNGYYSVTITEQTQGQYRFEVTFSGDGTYAGVTSGVEVAIGTLHPSKISATTNVANPSVGESYTLSGTLTDATGKPLPGEEIDLFQYVTGLPPRGDIFEKAYTDQNGHYSFDLKESTSGNYNYTAVFYGDQSYALSQASVSFTVGTLTPTTVTITTSNANPAVNQLFTISGTLKAGSTPIPGQTITLHRVDPSGTVSVVNTTTTDANGAYTFTRSESAQGRYTFEAVFSGGPTYALSYATVSLTVG
jgi:protocatechuate 3,4-dioxygenase beta subunit